MMFASEAAVFSLAALLLGHPDDIYFEYTIN